MTLTKLGGVCNFVRGPFGGALKKDCFVQSGFAVYEQQHAIYRQFSTIRYYIDKEKFEELKRFELRAGDLIMSCSGTMGKVAKVPKGIEKGIINQALLKLTPSENINLDFLTYWMESKSFQDQLSGNTHGAAIKNIASVKILKDLEIPLPPLPEQQKIAAILDAADKLKQKDQQLIEKYNTLSQSLFLDMFGDPVNNPMGWDKAEFGGYIDILTDYHANGSYEVLKENVELKNTEDYALMVRTTDLEHNNFTGDVIHISQHAYDYLAKSKVYGGEIIISKIGSAGKVFLMPYLNRPVSLGMNAFLLRFNEYLNNIFIYYLLTSAFGEIEIGKRIKGAVTKTIRKDALREINIPVPPITLQNQFAERIQAIESQKQQAQASLQKSEDLFNSLLQRAFKGELTN